MYRKHEVVLRLQKGDKQTYIAKDFGVTKQAI